MMKEWDQLRRAGHNEKKTAYAGAESDTGSWEERLVNIPEGK